MMTRMPGRAVRASSPLRRHPGRRPSAAALSAAPMRAAYTAESLPARFLASHSPCKSLTYLEATPGIEPVLQAVTRLVLPGELAEREVYELRNRIARAEEHIERRLQEAIADDKVVELPNWRRDVVA